MSVDTPQKPLRDVNRIPARRFGAAA